MNARQILLFIIIITIIILTNITITIAEDDNRWIDKEIESRKKLDLK